MTVLNKVDALDDEELEAAKAELEAEAGHKVMTMSGVTSLGVTDVLRALRSEITEDRLRMKPAEEAKPWQP